jgi:subtilase family serine protease
MPAGAGAGLQAAHIPMWQATHSARAACAGSRIGQAQCDVLIETGARTNSGVHGNYAGIGAAELEKAYNLPSSTKGKGQTVAIVDAYDNPDVVSDFNEYRSTMGLPSSTLNKYNQDGQESNYPTGSPDWGVEIDLDVDMVSASCPNCTVDLIEANSNSWSDLETAETEAVKLGATIVSNSYDGTGGSESSYDTKGITYLASAGDSGYGLYDPATFDSVIAVGGTFLNTDSGSKRGYSEVVWPDSGGGCSDTQEKKPSWQKDPDCTYRTGSDIGAVAVDAAEYDTYDEGGWIQVDGTSISSPLTAGMVALAGNSTKQDGGENLWKLSKKELKKDLYYIKTGSDGSCGGEYLCTDGTKQFGQFGGPTGWGTPHGVGAL